MDRQERKPDPEEVLRRAFKAMQARLWAPLPAIVTKVDLTSMTLEAQPAIICDAPQEDGTTIPLPIPPVGDCPIIFPGGGGAFLEFPIAVGDEVLLIPCARSIDNWFSLGGVQPQSEKGRMHNLSDCVALCGLRSLPRKKTIDSTVRLRNDANTAYIDFNPGTGAVNIVAPGGITLNGVTVDSSGLVTTANDVVAGGKHLKTHTHNDPQGGVTAGPN